MSRHPFRSVAHFSLLLRVALAPALIIFTVCLLVSPLLGAGRGRIRGTVRDPDREPVAGLQVRLVSAGEGAVRITNTDDRGIYAFEDLEAGSYDVEVSGTGFEPQVKERILVRPPFRNIVDFHLAEAPLAEGEKVPPVSYQPPPGDPVYREVAGHLTDRDKKPIPDVWVSLTNPVTGASFRAQSDEEGKILIPKVPAGTYRAVISSPGYVTVELKQARVSPQTGLTLTLSLVEYPLHFEGRVEDLIPSQEPVPPDHQPSET